MMNEIPENAVLVSMSNNDDHLAVFAVAGVYTEIVVCECWLGDDGKPVTSNYYSNVARLYLTPEEARALAATLLKVTTEAAPSTKDALIDRALADALDALDETMSIMAAFAERARQIAHQEARDAE